MHFIQAIIAFFGRAFIAIIFIASGLHKILAWTGSESFFTTTATELLSHSVGQPLVQQGLEWALDNVFPLLVAATAVEIVCGLLIFLGLWVRLASLILFLYLIPTTLLFHHFWLLQSPDSDVQIVQFLKNIAIMGGLLNLLAYGRGGASRRSEKKPMEKAA